MAFCRGQLGTALAVLRISSVVTRELRGTTKSLISAVEDDAAPWSLADGTGYANECRGRRFSGGGRRRSTASDAYADATDGNHGDVVAA